MSVAIIRRTIPKTTPADTQLNLGELHPVLRRIYQVRQIQDPRQLDYSLQQLLPFTALKGIGAAVDLLTDALHQQQRLLIIGDFDADGATSVALAMRGLKRFGFNSVDYLVPNRFEFGYGLTPEIVAIAAQRQPDLIVTVDNGISSIDGVAAAKQHGIKVLVTDHHLPGEVLPAADAIVNPNQQGDAFPSKALAGVGVMFYVLLALRAALRESNWFKLQNIPEPNLAELLDIVALGTVADVVPLDHNNRVLVAQGLARIRSDHCCAGIRALIQVARRQQQNLVATDLAFGLGPRLNAAGRLEDMSLGIECLLTDDPDKALRLAHQLDELNQERRNIENDMKQQAVAYLERLHLDEAYDMPLGLCLFDAEWHQGVIGILAARIKELYHRPVIIFADAGQTDAQGEGLIKGSARSIPQVHIRDVLDAVAAHHPGLLSKFGGHAMAAGLTIRNKDLAAFTQAFNHELQQHITAEDLCNTLYSDGALTNDDINLQLAEQIRFAGPWGQAFPEPLFDGTFELVNRRVVGEQHLKLSLRMPGHNDVHDAIAFRTTDSDWPQGVAAVHLAYKLDVNEYQGFRRVQLLVEHLEPAVQDLPLTRD